MIFRIVYGPGHKQNGFLIKPKEEKCCQRFRIAIKILIEFPGRKVLITVERLFVNEEDCKLISSRNSFVFL